MDNLVYSAIDGGFTRKRKHGSGAVDSNLILGPEQWSDGSNICIGCPFIGKTAARDLIRYTGFVPRFQPMPLGRLQEAFSHPDWLFEVKWDGFRALLHSYKDGVRLVSSNGNVFKSFTGLCESLARDLKHRHCVLDGEIVCLDSQGKPDFRNLLFRRREPVFYAFDLLWDEHARSEDEEEQRRVRNGEDLRYRPLCDPELPLRAVVTNTGERLLYCDHIKGDGEGLFRLASEHDLEGIAAKHKHSPYLLDREITWMKIRNCSYSQWVGREELFERARPPICKLLFQ